ncbi:hypothetical protein EJB05_44261, partial [Eragrostis curvula]
MQHGCVSRAVHDGGSRCVTSEKLLRVQQGDLRRLSPPFDVLLSRNIMHMLPKNTVHYCPAPGDEERLLFSNWSGHLMTRAASPLFVQDQLSSDSEIEWLEGKLYNASGGVVDLVHMFQRAYTKETIQPLMSGWTQPVYRKCGSDEPMPVELAVGTTDAGLSGTDGASSSTKSQT